MAATAYTSLLSLASVLHEIHHHPCPPITLDKHLVNCLAQNLDFLQGFLEGYSSVLTDGLENRIADAAYAVEDVIELYILQQSRPGSTSQQADLAEGFQRDLTEVALDLDSVTKGVMKMKEKLPNNPDHGIPPHDTTSTRPPFVVQQDIMVGFDDVLHEVLDKLTGDQRSLQTVAIVGMGGSGKTTLTRKAYEHQLVKQDFDHRVWVTVSQYYNLREILLKVLDDQNSNHTRQLSVEDLGVQIHRLLFGRRYLLTLDDMWSTDVWDEISRFLPDNNNRSRIVITTRLSTVASRFSNTIQMHFLDQNHSWDLFCKVVFGHEACPDELEVSGRKIVEDCKGLPLSIAVIGGLLAKSKQTKKSWISVAKKLNLSLTLEHEQRCLQILHSSYDHLPLHLKPCFLYMGVFVEDSVIRVSNLIKLWIAEGFLSANSEENLEMVAYGYLLELVHRNLILVKSRGSRENIKTCSIHDLVRDLCIKQAEGERFSFLWKYSLDSNQQGLINLRRVAFHNSALAEKHLKSQCDNVVKFAASASFARSYTLDMYLPPDNITLLLRVFNMAWLLGFHDYQRVMSFFEAIFLRVNVRFIAQSCRPPRPYKVPSSDISSLWNLQTLILTGMDIEQLDIWKMYRLRHIKAHRISLRDPPFSSQGNMQDQELVLQNLQTLSIVKDLVYSEEVITRIPNIKRLKITDDDHREDMVSGCDLNNLNHLLKLESLTLSCFPFRSRSDFLQNLSFPRSLIKLELRRINLPCQDYINTEIGSLPRLRVLKLVSCGFGHEWRSAEDQFPCLRILRIESPTSLRVWEVESDHFPRLELLDLRSVKGLEIPSEIGDIPTLQEIRLKDCGALVVNSAYKILEEQHDFGNFSLTVQVIGDVTQEESSSSQDCSVSLVNSSQAEQIDLPKIIWISMTITDPRTGDTIELHPVQQEENQ